MSRRKIIAGNWKMNKKPSETAHLVNEVANAAKGAEAEVVVCPPYTALVQAVSAANGSNVSVGAQNMHFEEKGAFTGEVSAEMLLDIGVKYVIIGHSERRQFFGETDEAINKKIKKALSCGLTPIFCCGESLQQREMGITNELIRTQIKIAFGGISKDDAKKVVIAYEPIWAIGTGKTATAEQADEVCAAARDTICGLYDGETGDVIRIQYGGSMNASNAAQLLSMPNIDGGLIGGASLSAEDFAAIINCKGKKDE